jgi:ankyrin repeat protein
MSREATTPSHSREELLLQAIQFGRTEEAERLLMAGADPNATNGFWEQPLLLTAARKGDAAFVRVLIEAGADIHVRSNTGETPLMAAVRHGHEENIKYLLSKGANAALKNAEGESAADIAEGILEQNQLNVMSGALNGTLRENEQQLLGKWYSLTTLLKQAERDALSVALKDKLAVGKPLQLKRR